jgi:hypothetical protein
MKDEDFNRDPDAEGSQQVGPVLRRHTEVKSQQESEHSGDHDYRELSCAHYPPSVMGKTAGNALDIEW